MIKSMSQQEETEKIIAVIRDKAVCKQNVFDKTKECYTALKGVLESSLASIQEKFGDADSRVEFHFKDQGEYQAEIKVAGDVLIFFMHTNVFQIEQEHSLWRTSYLKEDPARAYVGVINIYNFLADSFKYHRVQDLGYLIARIYVNKEGHFLVQGKRQLGFLYNNFINAELNEEAMQSIVNSALLYTLDFDLLTPPYQSMQEVSVQEIQALSQHLNVATGKRLGFKFSNDEDTFE